MKIALTGHTTARMRGKDEAVNDWLKAVLTDLSIGDEDELLCGGAEGADTLFGECAFLFPHVKLKLCLPIKGYRSHALDALKQRANDIFWVSEVWEKGLNTKRDHYMVDNCDVLLAVWDGIKDGGTWRTIQYAQKRKKKIIFIDKEVFFDEN